MHNTPKPDLNALPSMASLIKSTIVAGVAAGAIAITVVMPAEYGIDPTGVGKVIGLTEMGEIKAQLAEEADLDRQQPHDSNTQSTLINHLINVLVGTAHAQDAAEQWVDEVTFTLTPGEGAEIKLVMQENATAEYRWVATGGLVNFDLHGHGGGQSISYEKGRGAADAKGTLVAKFTGDHGWFWRNRDKQDVSVTLQVRGDYDELKSDQ